MVALDSRELDPVELEILRNQLESVAEEMGQVLIRGAYSPNITERRDCSTALFDADGRMIAQAEHIPVHLGAMPEAVDAVLEHDPEPGDVFVLNDPFTGGTHLPDVTLVSPIAPATDALDGEDGDGSILGYAVSRAHHADVGGMAPGSMPAGARDIHQEGFRIPPVRLVEDGEIDAETESLLLANVRNPGERRADLRAQIAANERAEARIDDLLADHGDRLLAAFDAVIDYSRERVEAELRDLPDGTYRASDAMEGDGVTDDDVPVEVTVTVDGAAVDVDFAGTADQVAGNVNAPLTVAKSAVYFVIRCVTDPEIPPNHGCYEPVSVSAPEGSLLNPDPPAAVVGGNVETSQRVTDVVFAALADAAPERVPAGGQGTMNNVVVGDDDFAYYETVGGGAGANPGSDGLSGVQVGMTNTLNTPVEALEAAYPLRVERYALREDSGGDGRYRGGDGLVRSLEVQTDATVSLLTERRRHAPRGIAGGADAEPGINRIGGERAPSKVTRAVAAGTTVTVETPGGGGHGPAAERPADDSGGSTDSDGGKSETATGRGDGNR
ncbi:hydantoinase B/oxoprolinase family protein [Halosimplex salinum]|uniref:hydantoinase B/oxoprolinase family protein n=1 Tax=Halosimplex salinum TaxID=1710538 RepID=UPI000F4A5AE9|nr:hydantoinase B/oxoprolinase family protein [Halosimplex salinum]